MARTGRPPVPAEVKRKRGTARPDRMPAEGNVIPLAPAPGMPDFPADLGLEGQRLWEHAWDAAILWLSPKTDMEAVERACRLVDDLAKARTRYQATGDPSDARAVVGFDKQYGEALSALGFGPVARSRLGVAEVKAVSKLDELRARQRNRDSTGS